MWVFFVLHVVVAVVAADILELLSRDDVTTITHKTAITTTTPTAAAVLLYCMKKIKL